MNKETEFTGKLNELLERGAAQDHFLTEAEVRETYSDLELTEEQLQMVYDYLRKHHVGVGEPLKDSDYLESEELDFLEMYMDELSMLPTFTDGEKEAAAMSAMAGDPEAQSRLICMHLPEVVDIAKLYTGQGVFLEDLIGEGNVALSIAVTMLGALESASEVPGMLTRRIMDGMEEHIRMTNSESEVDEKILKTVNRVADRARELSEEYRRKVTVDELVSAASLSRKSIEDAIRLSGGIEYIVSDQV